ncbi:GDP-L-fucose synthase [Prochlorococcus sp. MIT 1223]|uniref:GDP-L-fucose synthase family protein n=1 Tax=Prochlorococcus sp. MIT 1223 TaxID=3096217 RepID=UPI002A74C833|nr:GDP-L-fucose synthase [Prochlorococcus sp. MIT 1223]
MTSLIGKSDRIFVAGHKGMAGSSIIRALEKEHYTNLLTASRQDLDLSDINNVHNWFKNNRPEVVVIAAAKVGGIKANESFPVQFLLENMKIQNNVIETAWNEGVKRLLFLGSSCIYPKYAQQPIKEEDLLTGSLEPTNEWYAIAKISGIKLCMALKQQYDFDAISLMPTNLYGPGDNYHSINSHVLPAFIRRFDEAINNKEESVTCWGSGSPMREFLHVDDLGEACVFALENWRPNKNDIQHLNVGTGVDITIKELAEEIAEIAGFSGEIIWDSSKPDGTPKKQLDISRLSQMGWKSKIKLREGLKKTIYSFRNQKDNIRL